MSDTIDVEMVSSFRMLVVKNEPDLIVIEIKTQDGSSVNYGVSRENFAHTVSVWNIDLNAINGAVDRGTPLPGKPLGQKDAKAN